MLQQFLVLLIQPLYLPVKPADVPPDRLSDAPTYALIQSVALPHPLLHKLATPAQQLPQLLAIRIRFRLRRVRLSEHHAVAGQYLGIKRVGLRLVAARTGESAHPDRMRHIYADRRLPQSADHKTFIPTGGLAYRPGHTRTLQMPE